MADHSKWYEYLEEATKYDLTATDSDVKNREQSRFVSVCQFASGMWLDIDPDGSLRHARQGTALWRIAVQRRLGLSGRVEK